MKINPDLLKELADSLLYRRDDLLLTCFAIFFNLKVELNSEHLVELSFRKVITKSFDGIKLLIPLFEQQISYSDVKIPEKELNQFRHLFLGIRPGSTGRKEEVKEHLKNFIERTGYKMNEIIGGTKYFIELTEQRFIPNPVKFINESLETAIEESQIKNKDWIT